MAYQRMYIYYDTQIRMYIHVYIYTNHDHRVNGSSYMNTQLHMYTRML